MPLRDVKPFDEKQMKQLLEAMKRGPTEKQLEFRRQAHERFKDDANVEFHF